MKIDFEFKGLKEVIDNIEGLARTQVPIAAAKALTKTAQDVKDAEIKQLQSSIDRPTPYILNSVYVKYATKQKLQSEVGFKDYAGGGSNKRGANIILPQVEGGKRVVKSFESALQRIGVLPNGMYIAPGAACQLDAYGNIPGGLIVQILSYFKAFNTDGFRANITDKRKAALAKGSKRTMKAGYEYFVSYGKGSREGRQHLPAGIYKRVSLIGQGSIKPIMMFVKTPSYQKRFSFYETATQVINQRMIPNFNEAMKEALLTMKRTG